MRVTARGQRVLTALHIVGVMLATVTILVLVGLLAAGLSMLLGVANVPGG